MKKIICSLFIVMMLFANVDSYSQATNKIDAVGNVGIGTISPGTKLVVGNLGLSMPTWQSAWFQDGIGVAGLGTSSATYLYSDGSSWWGLNAYDYASNTYKDVSIGWGGTSNVLLARGGGNVGIGTISPGTKLVVGNLGLSMPAWQSAWFQDAIGVAGLGTSSATYLYSDGSSWWGLNAYDYASNTYKDVSIGWGGTSNVLLARGGGNVGIGTTSPSERLSVNGNISSKKSIVTQTGWSDYVFNDDYNLKPLSQVEKFIKDNKHLPEVPSAKEVEEKGLDLGANQAVLLKKIEELTLYLLEQEKRNQEQDQKISELTKELEAIKKTKLKAIK